MPPMNVKWYVFGRPVKPVAFALMASMLIVAEAAFADVGVLGAHWLADVLGGAAIMVAIVFFIAWFHSSQRLTELALLLSCFLWTTRFWLILFISGEPITKEGFLLSACWAIVAGGSYLLERMDSKMTTRGF